MSLYPEDFKPIGLTVKTPYGLNEVGSCSRGSAGWMRVDRYTGSFPTDRPTLERRFAAAKDDVSAIALSYGPAANCEYDAGCSCCWLGFSHTIDCHNQELNRKREEEKPHEQKTH